MSNGFEDGMEHWLFELSGVVDENNEGGFP
jgi:hypothetical protein